MAIEKYIAGASLGLFVMFVAEILTVFNFLIESPIDIEAAAKIFMFISIGAAPAVVMAGTSFMLARNDGSKAIGSMIIAGGGIMLVGMFVANSMIPNIGKDYLIFEVTITPLIFMVVSIPVMIVGGILLKTKKRKRVKRLFPEDDSKKRHVKFNKKSIPCVIGFHDLCLGKSCECTCHY